MDSDNILFADVLIVGAGPSGLSTAIHLADELKKIGDNKKIMVIEKGNAVGAHILSGAVIKTDAFKELLSEEEFDGLPFDCEVTTNTTLKLSENGSFKLPFHPPYMNNIGNKIASLGQICKYLAQVAESKGVEVYAGFSVRELLYENDKVIGVKTVDTGLDEHGIKQKNYQEGTRVKAKVIVLAEGIRGSLAKQLKNRFDMKKDSNSQVYSLGIKELWSVPETNIKEGDIYHTFGYPLNTSEEFGGGFIYGLKDNKVAVGFVVGLDYKDPTLDPHALMQVWKQHSAVKKFLEGGEIIEFGAKALPEGGWDSIPKLYTHNVLIVGDSAGFVAMPALKGIHLSVTSGMCAAKTILNALRNSDTSESSLAMYKELIDNSRIKKEMYPVRNFRAVMTQGICIGTMKFGVQLLTGGACAFVPKLEKDNATLKKKYEFDGVPFAKRFEGKLEYDKKLTFDKDTSVFYSGTFHEEEQPSHLHVEDYESFSEINIKQYGMASQYFCPADVYEEHVDRKGNHGLKIHSENCVHCKTCDIKTPNDAITWMTPYGSDGPQYQNM
ncbi:MAG TPA: electron transfer flavoprotein [Sulfurospirillum arcachonense]|nr:electron transfer flavoprotein [Sulfurospirillum arcachonense]